MVVDGQPVHGSTSQLLQSLSHAQQAQIAAAFLAKGGANMNYSTGVKAAASISSEDSSQLDKHGVSIDVSPSSDTYDGTVRMQFKERSPRNIGIQPISGAASVAMKNSQGTAANQVFSTSPFATFTPRNDSLNETNPQSPVDHRRILGGPFSSDANGVRFQGPLLESGQPYTNAGEALSGGGSRKKKRKSSREHQPVARALFTPKPASADCDRSSSADLVLPL